MQERSILTIASLVLNAGLLLVFGLYAYKTRQVLIGWFNYFANRQPNGESPFYRQRMQAFRKLKDSGVNKPVVVFMGDSMVHTYEWAEHFRGLDGVEIINRGINGDNVAGVAARAESDLEKFADIEKLLLMVGVNDIGTKRSFSALQFLSRFETLLDNVSKRVPAGRVYVHSLLPVLNRPNVSNDDIVVANRHLRQLCEKLGVNFVDLHSRFMTAEGKVNGRYLHSDGLHLSAEGYGEWISVIEPIVRGSARAEKRSAVSV